MRTLRVQFDIYPTNTGSIKKSQSINLKLSANLSFWRERDLTWLEKKNMTAQDFTNQLWCELAEKIKAETGMFVDLDGGMHTSFDVIIPTNTTPEKQKEIEEKVIDLIKEVYLPEIQVKLQITHGRKLEDWIRAEEYYSTMI